VRRVHRVLRIPAELPADILLKRLRLVLGRRSSSVELVHELRKLPILKPHHELAGINQLVCFISNSQEKGIEEKIETVEREGNRLLGVVLDVRLIG